MRGHLQLVPDTAGSSLDIIVPRLGSVLSWTFTLGPNHSGLVLKVSSVHLPGVTPQLGLKWRETEGQVAGRVDLPVLDPATGLTDPQLVNMEQDILSAALCPEDPGVESVVSDDNTSGALALVEYLLQSGLMLLFLPRAPPEDI